MFFETVLDYLSLSLRYQWLIGPSCLPVIASVQQLLMQPLTVLSVTGALLKMLLVCFFGTTAFGCCALAVL
jgi:hypothetical protein